MEEIGYLIISVAAWVVLGIVMYVAFLRMQISERETQLPAEKDQTPLYELIGSGSMNGARAVRRPFARFTLYDTFFAACFKTQRKAVDYTSIQTMELKQYLGKEWLYIKADDPDRDTSLEILFNAVDHGTLLDQIARHQQSS